MKSISRRSALQWLLSLTAIGAALPSRVAAAKLLRELEKWDGEVLPMLRNRESAAAIGQEFLRRRPEEADLHQIAARIGPVASISARVLQDFESGRTIILNGWILSETEARVCALSALAHGR